MSAALVIVLVLLIIAGGAMLAYNSLVKRRNRTGEAWSQIDVELKRRHDLVPNLVATVKGYAAHESGTFEAVTASRAAAISAGASADPAAVAAAENGLSHSLRSLFAVAENYPALRAQEGFLALQEQLAASEDKLEYARRYYNTSARDYNTAVQSFPRAVLAAPLGFHPVAFYTADPADAATPDVDFAVPTVPPVPTVPSVPSTG
jgi:LemA protein